MQDVTADRDSRDQVDAVLEQTLDRVGAKLKELFDYYPLRAAIYLGVMMRGFGVQRHWPGGMWEVADKCACVPL